MKGVRTRALVVSICLAVSAGTGSAGGANLVGRASVIDGDTIEIHGRRVRIAGIDAVESDQICWWVDRHPWRCGQLAALALSELIGSRTVSCLNEGQDLYGRMLGRCFVQGTDLGTHMVSEGYAIPYYDRANIYKDAAERARQRRKAIWSGAFDTPSAWRKQRVP